MRAAILPDSDPILRQVSRPVETFDDDLKRLAASMAEAMMAKRGLGLAAVQIGQPVRLVIVRDRGSEELFYMVNPVVSRPLRRLDVKREGCLSVPEAKWKPIARPAKVDCAWCDLDGKEHSQGFSGWLARAVQHEVEHLDGILITDHPAAPLPYSIKAR
jgi:peptide deformylase